MAKALYDYTRQTDEELSFKEDDQIQVFDVSDPDWTLVGLDGEYGFVPANYIEAMADQHESQASAPPNLPQRPASASREESQTSSTATTTTKAPAAALAGIMNNRQAPALRQKTVQFTPDVSDEEEAPTPTLPTRPKSIEKRPEPVSRQHTESPISPGIVASPPYNRVVHGRSIDEDVAQPSPGGFHMYNINEMVVVMGKRKKMPTTLGINIATGTIMIAPEKSRDGPEQSWTVDKMTHYSIEEKHVFLELVRPSRSIDFHAGAKDTAQEIVSALGDLSGAYRAEGLREVLLAGASGITKKGQMLYDFEAQGDDEVSVEVGDEIIIVDDTKSEEWWHIRRVSNGKEGVVPSSYVEVTGIASPPIPSNGHVGKQSSEQKRLDEERSAKASLRAARHEDESKAEVGPGMILPDRGSSLSARRNNNISVEQKSRRDHRKSNGSSSKTSKSCHSSSEHDANDFKNPILTKSEPGMIGRNLSVSRLNFLHCRTVRYTYTR